MLQIQKKIGEEEGSTNGSNHVESSDMLDLQACRRYRKEEIRNIIYELGLDDLHRAQCCVSRMSLKEDPGRDIGAVEL
jgi:hypothetical protein